MAKKGTVRELSSLFPAEEAHKASMRVQETISERRGELEKLRSFLDDNTAIINLVRKLPDETHHDIMVPFGQAAFFPGRMTNPNKFLVLLGEGYHAERSAKQTVEILKRRGKALETQIESLNAVMEDLKLEASFFDNTAHESAEGVVEIREDYIEEEEALSSTAPTSGKQDEDEAAVEDAEYARMLARMAELEREEEEAEEANRSDENEQIQNEQDNTLIRDSTNQEVRSIPPAFREASLVSKEGASHGNYPANNNAVVNKDFELPKEEKKIGSPLPASNTAPSRNNVVVKKDFELPQEEKKIGSPLPASNTAYPARNNVVVNKDSELPRKAKKIESPPPVTNTAFTGSIVEHAHNIGGNAPQPQGGARSSKPVSRFKMQRKQ